MTRSAAGVRPRTLTGRLLLWHSVAVLGVLLVFGVVADRVLEHYFVGQLTNSLIADARATQLALSSSDNLQAETVRLSQAVDARITMIRTDGVVLADSQANPATLENHRTRPEVIQALAGRIGESSRVSASVGIPFRYVALPPMDGRIVRVALPLTIVQSKLDTIRLILGIGIALALLAGLGAMWAIARGLSRPLRQIADSVDQVGRGNLGTEVPERGSKELVALVHTVNRMRRDVASQIDALQEERRVRDAILTAMEEGVVLFQGDGSVVYANDQARRLLGGTPEHLRNLALPTLQASVASAAQGQRLGMVEVVMGRESRTVRAVAEPLGNDSQILLVLRDVTEARVVDAVRRDFVANASHELKTPAASIRALAETIASASQNDPQAVPRFAGQLERESVRLARIISDLLDLSRLEGETGGRSSLRLDEIVALETDRYARRAAESGLSLTLRADEPVLVIGSERDLVLLVRNLVENAVQYTRPGGSVEVFVGVEGGQAVLRVRDTGIGIPSRDQHRVFERFYRVDRARSRETGGTGLGLSIVKHVAENHGGTVAVNSQLGRGSMFTVRLPLTRRVFRRSADRSEPALPPSAGA